MNRPANLRRHTNLASSILAALLVLVTAASYCVAETRAEDITSGSARLAEQSFALLDRLSKQPGDKPNPLVGPVASFAGDAESLRQSLMRRDLGSAKSSMASLQADRTAIDQGLVEHPDAIPAREWRVLREQSEKLVREIPGCGSDCDPAVIGSGAESSTETTSGGDSPRIVITSRESGNGTIRLRGYFEGTAIRSAGIYVGSDRLRRLKVDRLGRERVEFDLRFENPSPATVLRVIDSDGRGAEAPVIDASLTASSAPIGAAADSLSSVVPEESSEPRAGLSGNSGTVEIPSHGPLLPSPSKRHTMASRLGDVTINVLHVTRTANLPPTYEIVGQITGKGITHAGIYLNGRLVRPIQIMSGSNYTSFNQPIVARAGPTTIRAYSLGNQFIEQSVDLDDATDPSDVADYPDDAVAMATPLMAPRIAVQITSIRALGGGTYLISGSIAGNNVVSAGLYQNGVLAQNINPSAGLAGALAALIPGASRSINFGVRFNPYAGPATIRAFDSTGAYTEQPVIVVGISPNTPRWPNSVYGGTGSVPYGTGLSASPYRNWPATSPPHW
jgi:hypothetical protein